ncbi:MAG: hypothetical protein IJ703_12010 [Eubacterium sp.]|nr:hypothetical protein [Eubacterium sp.]MBR1675665.1 hypothetical protein [Eubacterium sp.]
MAYELKSDANIDVEKLVSDAGQNSFFFDDSGPNDYGEILRLYQIGRQLKEEYELQYKNTYVRERELKSNMKHAALLLGLYVGMIVMDLLVKYLFGIITDFKGTFKGFLAFMHFALLFGIAIGAVLVAIPFTVNLLKQMYLYKMLTNPAHELDDDRERYHVITLNDERKFLRYKIAEYDRLFGRLDKVDTHYTGVLYSKGNKVKADHIMASYTKKDMDDMHRFSNLEEFRAQSTKEKEKISAWWIMAGAMIPMIIAILVIAGGLSGQINPGF